MEPYALFTSADMTVLARNAAPFSQCLAPIRRLPPELLLEIFMYLYTPHHSGIELLYGTWLRDDISSRSLFPNALAEVCQQWKDVLLSVSKFWTGIVIWVETMSTSTIRTMLQSSSGLLIDVAVVSRGSIDSKQERAQLATIAALIAPHMHRCLSLRIHANHCSSLPVIREHFHGAAPNTLLLEFSFNHYDGEQVFPAVMEDWSFSTPAVVSLKLDGHNFWECALGSSWFAEMTSLRKLHIGKYEHRVHHDIPLFDVLHMLRGVSGLASWNIKDCLYDPRDIDGSLSHLVIEFQETKSAFTDCSHLWKTLEQMYKRGTPLLFCERLKGQSGWTV
ncbi:hypothetical protein BV22DRAFT_678109 [Leucogyrophana mollusca]|uniref:Uncharacterized protein n=1 Tax=Leucogyrophana mollusca TaxID=85980 RepID=A0ACB8B9Q7_9AGAM|nr:hypothetical protein BV22DRAFT_678109 [Leucogyrophana mollusca]